MAKFRCNRVGHPIDGGRIVEAATRHEAAQRYAQQLADDQARVAPDAAIPDPLSLIVNGQIVSINSDGNFHEGLPDNA